LTTFHNHRVIEHNTDWMKDHARNLWYRDIINTTVKGKRVVEAGSGAGLFLQYALEAGADHVTGIEINTERAKFITELLSEQGFKNFDIINDDFLDMPDSFLDSYDVGLCEHTGYEFSNNLLIMKIMSKMMTAKLHIIPEVFGIDVHVYDGEVEQSKPFVKNDSIPDGYYKYINKKRTRYPTESHIDIWKMKQGSQFSFDIDLKGYRSATIFIDSYISYNGKRCPYQTGYDCWDKPYRIHIPEAKSKFTFQYNNAWQIDKKSI